MRVGGDGVSAFVSSTPFDLDHRAQVETRRPRTPCDVSKSECSPSATKEAESLRHPLKFLPASKGGIPALSNHLLPSLEKTSRGQSRGCWLPPVRTRFLSPPFVLQARGEVREPRSLPGRAPSRLQIEHHPVTHEHQTRVISSRTPSQGRPDLILMVDMEVQFGVCT